MRSLAVNRVFSALCAVLALMPLPALADACPTEAAPFFELSVQSGPVAIDHSKGKNAINSMDNEGHKWDGPSDARGNEGRGEWKRIGITDSRIIVKTGAEIRMLRLADGSYCGSFAKVTLETGFKGQTIYLPREFSPESCAYKAVLAHEQQHVSINQKAFEEFLPLIQQQGETLMQRFSPVRAATASAAQAALQKQFERLDFSVFNDMRTAQEERNKAIDTSESYRALEQQCSEW